MGEPKRHETWLLHIHNGFRLGWLIDPQNQTIEIYQQNQPTKIQPPFCDPILLGFQLNFSKIF